MVAFFPWLNVGRDHDFGDFQLVAYQREHRPAGPDSAAPDPALQAILDAVLAPFLAHTRPVNLATLLRIGRHALTDDLNEQERELAYGPSPRLSSPSTESSRRRPRNLGAIDSGVETTVRGAGYGS
jgi:hypothetical protein